MAGARTFVVECVYGSATGAGQMASGQATVQGVGKNFICCRLRFGCTGGMAGNASFSP